MSPHYTDIIVLISEQDKEVPQQLLSDDQSNSYCIVLVSLSAVRCCFLAIEFHTTTKETSKHTTYHISNAAYLFAMVGCLYCSSLSSFYDGWHFQYEEVTGNFDAAFARYRS